MRQSTAKLKDDLSLQWTMRSLISFIFVLFLYFGINSPAAIAAPIPIGVLPGLGSTFAGHLPENIGLHNQQLSPCPDSPNCVVSQNPDTAHAIEPIAYKGDLPEAKATLLKVLSVVPRTSIIENNDQYIRTEFQTQLMGFIDDGEFYFPPGQNVIHVRSAARLGESDLNLNRRRIEQIRLAMADLEA